MFFISYIKMRITKENCGNCIIFIDSKYKDNMIKYNNCPKRSNVGCPLNNWSKDEN